MRRVKPCCRWPVGVADGRLYTMGDWIQAQCMTEKFTHSSEGSDITTYLAVMDFRSFDECER